MALEGSSEQNVSREGNLNHKRIRWGVGRHGGLSVLLLVTVLLLSVYIPSEARAAAAFTVTPSPTTVGRLITLSGSGFASSTAYYGEITSANVFTQALIFCEGTGGGVALNPNPVSGSCKSSSTGTLSLTIDLWWGGVGTATVSICAVGPQVLTGTTTCFNGGISPAVATAHFDILPSVSLKPNSGPVGSWVMGGAYDSQTGNYYIGSGFDTNSGFGSILWDGNPANTAGCSNVDRYGNITAAGTPPAPSGCSFQVPPATYGTHAVTVTDGNGNSGVATFFVTPSLSLSQNAGPVGTVVTAAGTGFSGGASYQIFWTTGSGSQVVIASGTTDGTGSFTVTFTIPQDVAGGHAVKAIDANGVYSQVTYTITSLLAISPQAGTVGTAFTGTGTGFAASSTVTITWDSGMPSQAVYPTVTSNALGSLSFGPFMVPPSPFGTNTVTATDGSGNTYSAAFTVSASLSTTPYSGGSATTVSNTTALGFDAGSAMTLVWDPGLTDQTTVYGTGGVAGGSVTSNAAGSTYFPPWSLSLLPATATTRGIHTIEAQDTQGIMAISTFYVGAEIVLNPTFGYANSSFTVNGYDFALGQPSGTTVSVQILWPGLVTALGTLSFTTSASNLFGNFSTTVHAPFDPMGVYMVKATALVGGGTVSAFANFTLFPSVNESLTLPPPLGGGGPLAGPTGTADYLTFQGFPAATYVQIYYDGVATNLQSPTNARGSVLVPFAIPLSTAGAHTIYGEDAATDTSNTVEFDVTPAIQPATTATYIGNTVPVAATGFAAASPVTLTWDGSPLGGTTSITDGTGSVILSFQVPSPSGVHQLGAYDSVLDVAPAVPFTVWALGTPVLSSPVNGGYVNASTDPGLSLSWNPVPNANVTYTVELSTSASFGSGTRTVTGLTATALRVGPLAEGTYYWHVEAVTASGATSGWSTAWSFLVDTTAPTSNVHALPSTESALTFPLYWSANDSGSGVKWVSLYWSNTSGGVWTLVPGSPFTSSPVSFTAPGAGTYEFAAVAVDNAGNQGTFPGAQAWTTVDPLAPSTTLQLSGTLGSSPWYTGPVTVTLSASGGPSGVKALYVNLGAGWVTYTGPVTLSTNGVWTVCGYAVSGAGVTGPTVSRNMSIDSTVPTTSSNVQSGWYTTSPVHLTLNATGGPSGIAVTFWSVDGTSWVSGKNVTISGDGIHSLSFYSVSGAGLVEPTQVQTVKISSAAPTVQFDLSGPLGNKGWFTGPATVNLTASSSASGTATIEYQVNGGNWTLYSGPFLVGANGVSTLSAKATSNAGVTGPVATFQVSVDSIHPSTTSNVLSSWYTSSPVSLTLNTSGGPSGVAATYWSVDGGNWQAGTSVTVSGDGVHVLSFYSVSGAGLAGTVQQQQVRVDTQPPVTQAVLTGNITPSGWYSSVVTLTLVASDNASGVAGTWYSLTGQSGSWTRYGTPLVFAGTGEYTVQFYSVDVAGNVEKTQSVSFRIDLASTTVVFGIPDGSTLSGSPTHSFPITASDPAGISAIYVSLDGGPRVQIWPAQGGTASQTNVTVGYALPTGSLSNGEHLVTVTAVNVLGQSTTRSETVNVDNASLTPVVVILGVVLFLVLGLVGMLVVRQNRKALGRGKAPASPTRPNREPVSRPPVEPKSLPSQPTLRPAAVPATTVVSPPPPQSSNEPEWSEGHDPEESETSSKEGQ